MPDLLQAGGATDRLVAVILESELAHTGTIGAITFWAVLGLFGFPLSSLWNR